MRDHVQVCTQEDVRGLKVLVARLQLGLCTRLHIECSHAAPGKGVGEHVAVLQAQRSLQHSDVVNVCATLCRCGVGCVVWGVGCAVIITIRSRLQ